ncbi:trypsin-like serine protease [Streptomyces sp. NBC_00704]|uniref:trypsin-like serine protease n=1 Tax=Streptomyces sp. NBC_00704 TaxID=2975809 RepID=UPI002E32E5BD|nr:trypsin-like serine protease [Streptomyces sp. NBC_00704]
MGTPTSGGDRKRHRRRLRIGLPIAAAAVAATVAGALLTSSAQAAETPPKPKVTAPSAQELQKRLEIALAGDDVAGQTSKKSLTSGRRATVDPKIIGGTTTTITKAPWMAQLWYGDDRGTTNTSDDIGFFCGGTVVSPTKIVTAAHCVKGYDWFNHGTIITGTSQLATDTDLHGGTRSSVRRQWNHWSYNASTIDNDIAVLTLDEPVSAKPLPMIPAGNTGSYTAGTAATVFGWGRTTSANDEISDDLKTATLPVQSDATCAGYYGADFVKSHMVCAGNPATGSDTGTTSACNGDSGGPLVVGGRLVGVVSWGVTDCVKSGAYSVFSKVTTYFGAVYPRVDDTNLSLDHNADLFARNSSTQTAYEFDSKGTSLAPRSSWGTWSGYNLILQADLDRDGFQDLILRRSSDGDVFWEHFVPASGTWATQLIGDNWKSRLSIVAPGDVTGDFLPDLVSVDSAGNLWINPGRGNGGIGASVKAATGWNNYNVVRGHGDFNGDGRADLIARNKTSGAVYLFRGRGVSGTSAFAPGLKVATWSNTTYNAFATVGDVNGDGKADLLARTPAGTLYLYRGNGSTGSVIFSAGISLGTSFKQYDLFG